MSEDEVVKGKESSPQSQAITATFYNMYTDSV